MPAFVYLWNCRNGKVLYVNKALEAILGIKSEDILSMDIARLRKIIHPDDLHIVKALADTMKRTKKSAETHYRIIAQGKEYNVLCKNIPYSFDKNGNCLEMLNVGIDITELYATRHVLAEKENFLKTIMDHMPLLLFVKDAETLRYVQINKAFQTLFNKGIDEILNKTDYELFPGDTAEFNIARDREAIAKGKALDIPEETLDAGLHGLRTFHTQKIPIFDKDGKTRWVLGMAEDITERIQRTNRIRLLAAVTENANDGIIITDADNNIIAINQAFTSITRYTEKDVKGKKPSILKSGRYDEGFYKAMWDDIINKGSWSGEIWNRNKLGRLYLEWLNISTITDENGGLLNYVGVFTDLTIIKKSENQLAYMALHDPLTGIGNRAMLRSRLDHAIESAKHNGECLALLFMDLDNFKAINDIYGHNIGDQLLIETAQRLSKALYSNDTVIRFGGDEFVIMLERVSSKSDIAAAAENILQQFMRPFMIEGQTHFMGASIGIATFPEDAQTSEKLITAADTAMYSAKDTRKHSYLFYDWSLTRDLEEEMTIRNTIMASIGAGRFVLYYQPQVNIDSMNTIGLEALVRWNHPDLGMIPPNRFIPIAEKSHLIIPLGEWILSKACQQMTTWLREGVFNGKIAVNVSGIQIEHSNFPDTLKKTLDNTGLDPSHLELEVTESVAMQNPDNWIHIFNKIKDMGISISIDDFGTGYSSLSYLRRLPLNKLKIDKSFVDDIPRDDSACSIVNTIIVLAKSLGLNIVAEGVETEVQAAYLASQGCDIIQGYLYSRPLPPTEVIKRLFRK